MRDPGPGDTSPGGPDGVTAPISPPPSSSAPVRCASCGEPGPGPFCRRCGWDTTERTTPLRFFAAVFLKLGAIRRSARLYAWIARSPTRRTLEAAENGRLADGARFLEFCVGATVLVSAAVGVKAANNDLVATVAQSLAVFLSSAITYGLYRRAMRRSATIARTDARFLQVACLTIGFTDLPASIVGVLPTPLSTVDYNVHPGLVLLLSALIGVTGLAIAVCSYVYETRTWSRFWGTSKTRAFLTLVVCGIPGGVLTFAAVVGLRLLRV